VKQANIMTALLRQQKEEIARQKALLLVRTSSAKTRALFLKNPLSGARSRLRPRVARPYASAKLHEANDEVTKLRIQVNATKSLKELQQTLEAPTLRNLRMHKAQPSPAAAAAAAVADPAIDLRSPLSPQRAPTAAAPPSPYDFTGFSPAAEDPDDEHWEDAPTELDDAPSRSPSPSPSPPSPPPPPPPPRDTPVAANPVPSAAANFRGFAATGLDSATRATRGRTPVCYAEPSLRAKMRRPWSPKRRKPKSKPRSTRGGDATPEPSRVVPRDGRMDTPATEARWTDDVAEEAAAVAAALEEEEEEEEEEEDPPPPPPPPPEPEMPPSASALFSPAYVTSRRRRRAFAPPPEDTSIDAATTFEKPPVPLFHEAATEATGRTDADAPSPPSFERESLPDTPPDPEETSSESPLLCDASLSFNVDLEEAFPATPSLMHHVPPRRATAQTNRRLSFAAVLSSAASLPTPEEEPSASPSSPPPPTCERARRQAGSHADYKEPSVNRKMRRPD
jgi:hypothetical protein